MLLYIENSGESDKERSKEWLVNTAPDVSSCSHREHRPKITIRSGLKLFGRGPDRKCYLTLSEMTNFRFYKLKQFADDNLKFDENGREFSERVENTVGKGEIARYEQFLLFQQCFQKTCTTDT